MNRPGRLARKLWLARRPRAAILVYHRVADLACDPFLLAVTPRHFAEHLAVLKEQYVPIGLTELADAVRRRTVPHRAVVLTFDDGYGDNLRQAKPLLENRRAPATVFVVAGKVGSQEEFWWDELERLVLRPSRLPAKLELEIGGRHRHWEIGDGGAKVASGVDGRWNMKQGVDPSPRHRLYRELWGALHVLVDADREELMKKIRAWANLDAAPRAENLPLSAAEVSELASGGSVEIGAHGWTHSRLADLHADEQRQELRVARRRLEGILGTPVKSFAYPYGGRGDYTPETRAIVAEAGFECACANQSGWVIGGADCFELPRVRVFDWDGREFARRLKRFLWA